MCTVDFYNIYIMYSLHFFQNQERLILCNNVIALCSIQEKTVLCKSPFNTGWSRVVTVLPRAQSLERVSHTHRPPATQSEGCGLFTSWCHTERLNRPDDDPSRKAAKKSLKAKLVPDFRQLKLSQEITRLNSTCSYRSHSINILDSCMQDVSTQNRCITGQFIPPTGYQQ